MPYNPVTYNTGGPPGLDGPGLNALGSQYLEASLSFGPDLLTPFVLTGMTAAKDGTTPTKLNLAAGTAYPLQTDGTLRQRKITAQSFTTSVVSTTYYLDLNPDGSLSWGTSHSGTANHLTLCSVTTDPSANILTVTDARQTTTTLLPNAVGVLQLLGSLIIDGMLQSGAGGSGGSSTRANPAALLSSFYSTLAVFCDSSNNLWSFAPSYGGAGNTRGIALYGVDGSNNLHQGLLVASDGSVELGSIRNGAVTLARIFTGSGTPSSPNVGDIWFPS